MILSIISSVDPVWHSNGATPWLWNVAHCHIYLHFFNKSVYLQRQINQNMKYSVLKITPNETHFQIEHWGIRIFGLNVLPLENNYISRHPLNAHKALLFGSMSLSYQTHTVWLTSRKGLGIRLYLNYIHSNKMMAARFLRCSLPVLRQARCYADAPSGSAQMSFTFASPTQVI